LNIISKDFAFPLLINNTSAIAISEGEKVTRNARHIDICYHHIRNLIKKKTIEISHISTGEMAADDLTKTLLSNKFKEFIELIKVLRIETDSKTSNNKPSNSKPNDDEISSNDKNDEKFMANYYKTDKEADKEISFKAEEAG